MEVGGQRHALAALPLGMTRYPLYRMVGGPQGHSEWVRNISPPQVFDPLTVQFAAFTKKIVGVMLVDTPVCISSTYVLVHPY
jgi:hypothetical protein